MSRFTLLDSSLPRRLAPILLAFLLLRLIFWLTTFPNPDEAYYWLWGQHPDWSYYDHPPFHAWVQGAFAAVLGRSNAVLRLPNLISNGILFYTYYRLLHYLYGEAAQRSFWFLLLLIVASPLYFLFLALAWQDHWLITFSLVAGYLFVRFADSYIADGKGETWQLYGAAVALAFAMLCKYNAVFVPLSFLATILSDKRLRPLLKDWRLYIAGAIAIAGLMPIVIWNAENQLLSFRYYVDRSVNTGSFSLKLAPCLNFILFSILLVSPFNVWGFYRSLTAPSLAIQSATYRAVAIWGLVIPTVILTIISLLSAALYYWNITAYLLLFPLLPALWLPNSSAPDRRFFLGAQAFGLLFASLLVIHYSLLPLSALLNQDADPDSRMLFGWPEVAAVVTQAANLNLASHPVMMTTDYRSASALAYQLNQPNVLAISDRRDQFDIWFERNPPSGRNAVVVSDNWHPISTELVAQFERVSEPTIVPITRFGVWIKNYYVVTADHFQPSP